MIQRAIKRFFRKKQRRVIAAIIGVTVLLFVLGLVLSIREAPMTKVNPATYQTLLATIAKGESNGNYNAYYTKPNNAQIRFTDMTIGEVLQWQESFVNGGSPSSAVGKYQIVRPTLNGLVKQLGVSQQDRFDERMQDRMAIALIERRGAVQYVDNQISREQFAANLSQEWAALPKVLGDQPEQSYYAGDGLNKSSIKISEILGSVEQIQKL